MGCAMTRTRRWRLGLAALAGAVLLGAQPALACGGLVGPGGTVQLARTTTLAGYADGVEHYLTSFTYAGGGAKFGSIVPLPGVPTDVSKGGEWTLQRLVRETQPAAGAPAGGRGRRRPRQRRGAARRPRSTPSTSPCCAAAARRSATGPAQHGFGLSVDAPEVLDFYAARSPIFMAASFDARRAESRGQRLGDGTPIHLTIPTANPWVPLRILGLGHQPDDAVQADLYLLTERRPAMLPRPAAAGDRGVALEQSGPASTQLLGDLRADKGMGWLPASGMWLSYLRIDTTAGALTHDLAVDASGRDRPSPVAAGLAAPAAVAGPGEETPPAPWLAGWWPWAAVALVAPAALAGLVLHRRGRSALR